MATETLIWLIPLPPVLAFFLIVLFTNKSKVLSHTIGVGAAALSFLGSMVVFFRAIGVEHLGEHPFESAVDWLPTGDTWFRIGVLIDPLGAAVLFFVYLGEPNLQGAINARLDDAQSILQKAVTAVGDVPGEIHTELIEGDSAEAIIDVAKTRKSDVIVMGSRGLGRLAGLVLGSTSQKVVSHAPCPVLIVR